MNINSWITAVSKVANYCNTKFESVLFYNYTLFENIVKTMENEIRTTHK